MNKRTSDKAAANFMMTNRLLEDQYYPTSELQHTTEVKHMTTEQILLQQMQQMVRKENELLLHGVRQVLSSHTHEVISMMDSLKQEMTNMIRNMTVTVGFTNPTQAVELVSNNIQLATQHILDKAKRLGMTFKEIHAMTPDIQVDMSMVPEEPRVKRTYTKRKPVQPLMNSIVFTPEKAKRGGRTNKDGTRINWMGYATDIDRRNAGFMVLAAHIEAWKDSTPTKFSKESQSVYSKLMDLCKRDEIKKWNYVLEDYFTWKTN
jgi:hypothetical protein